MEKNKKKVKKKKKKKQSVLSSGSKKVLIGLLIGIVFLILVLFIWGCL